MINLEREIENSENGYECPDCEGSGVIDKSTDCEVYDEIIDCTNCMGTGIIYDLE